jgi:hypothetical protein
VLQVAKWMGPFLHAPQVFDCLNVQDWAEHGASQ